LSHITKISKLLQAGLTLHRQGRLQNAQTIYEKILQIETEHFDALQLLGTIAGQTKDYKEAIKLLSKALLKNPNHAPCYNNLGLSFQGLGHLEQALTSYEKAIAINPSYADAYYNRGITLRDLGHLEQALTSYEKAIAINPSYAYAYYNRGITLRDLGHLEQALTSYEKAIAINPSYADAYRNLGDIFKELGHFNKAIESYEKALFLNPNSTFLLGTLQITKMFVCDWLDFNYQKNLIIEKLKIKEKVCLPFTALILTDDAALQQLSSEITIQDQFPPINSLGSIPKQRGKNKIRIGYFSADFGNHAVSFLTAELFELHNKDQFEIFGFSYGTDNQSPMHLRIKQSFDQFINVNSISDKNIAKLAREISIDIAIDLGGFTAQARTGIFAYRAAPIQISYIGYLGTMGSEYFDYIFADKTIIPTESMKFYSEKIIYLPSYQVNDSKRKMAENNFTREELGIPRNSFVFACFNNNYKILPDTFKSWMKILKATPESVLFIYADNKWAESNLIKEAEKSGINSQRLIFGKRLPRAEYLARYKVCDLFLDTFPYNAGTTASDALWSGLPVLTLTGQSLASRLGASLLVAIDLPELITTSWTDYEILATELAMNPQKISAIKNKLSNNHSTTLLFNTLQFTKKIEISYLKIMERYWEDLQPENIFIES
jgi:predicted O-linked N-acetylglucosamine transferase (SPINDLY family)